MPRAALVHCASLIALVLLMTACSGSRRSRPRRDASASTDASGAMDGAAMDAAVVDGGPGFDGGADLDGGPGFDAGPTDAGGFDDAGPPLECLGPSDCNDLVSCTNDDCRGGRCTHEPDDRLCDTGEVCELTEDCICTETPCRIASPQCGCAAAGQACYVFSDTRMCLTEGSRGQAGTCARQNDCRAAHVCAGVGVAQCHKVCESDADCPINSRDICELRFADTGISLCTGGCDPIAQTGCAPGSFCTIGESEDRIGISQCIGPIGSGTQGDSCSDGTQCAAGYGCAGECVKWCRPGFLDCPTGTTCDGLDTDIVVGFDRYNFCL